VEEVVDLTFQLFNVGWGDAQFGLCEITNDRDDTCIVTAPILVQFLKSRQLDGASQKMDDGIGAVEQLSDETLADETSGAGNEVIHCCLLKIMANS